MQLAGLLDADRRDQALEAAAGVFLEGVAQVGGVQMDVFRYPLDRELRIRILLCQIAEHNAGAVREAFLRRAGQPFEHSGFLLSALQPPKETLLTAPLHSLPDCRRQLAEIHRLFNIGDCRE